MDVILDTKNEIKVIARVFLSWLALTPFLLSQSCEKICAAIVIVLTDFYFTHAYNSIWIYILNLSYNQTYLFKLII